MYRYRCLLMGRLYSVKMLVLPNLIHTFNTILVKIQLSYFVAINRFLLKFIWRDKRPRITDTVSKERNKAGELTLLDCKIYHEATVIKAMWCWQNNGQVNQWKRIEGPAIDPHKHSPLSFDKEEISAPQWRKGSLFNKWSWNHWTSTCEGINLDLIPSTKINTKWAKT